MSARRPLELLDRLRTRAPSWFTTADAHDEVHWRLADKALTLGAIWLMLDAARLARDVFGDVVGWLRWLRYLVGFGLVGIAILLMAPSAAAIVPREAAATTYLGAGRLLCHRTFRSNGTWVQTPVGQGGGASGYYESDQDVADRLIICGISDDLNGRSAIISADAGAPQVGGATSINGITNMMTTTAGNFMNTDARLDGGTRANAPWIEQGVGGTNIVSWRWYMFNSNSTTCECAKRVDVGDYWTDVGCGFPPIFGTNVPISFNSGGDPNPTVVPGLNSGMFRGKWWRVEGQMNNWPGSGSPATFQTIWWKDLSTGLEYTATSSLLTLVNQQCQNSTGDCFINFIHNYRDGRSFPGSCVNGYLYLIVTKNMAQGERITPAVEVEGGSTAPAPPTFLRFAEIAVTLIALSGLGLGIARMRV